ncbi:MAG TPA: flagellar assembly protein FliW [Bryobacteraceae bacterium]|nr:flagellar assembly protein FliW [Bryobacteraceae bacterium]
MDYKEESVFEFLAGLPAFEHERGFVFIEMPEYAPLVFLQSLSQASLCFLALPVLAVDPGYRLAVSVEDRASLGLDPGREPAPGDGIVMLALVSLRDGFPPSANLMAPIVVNVRNRRGLQAIRVDRAYSHQHPVPAEEHYEGIC